MNDLFSEEMQQRAFRSTNGEFGWTRDDARAAVSILAEAQLAVLGGELWWVPEGEDWWTGLIPQSFGPDGVYPWESERTVGEAWSAFVIRCARESHEAIERWPGINDLPPKLRGRILYNLTWVSEDEFATLRERAR